MKFENMASAITDKLRPHETASFVRHNEIEIHCYPIKPFFPTGKQYAFVRITQTKPKFASHQAEISVIIGAVDHSLAPFPVVAEIGNVPCAIFSGASANVTGGHGGAGHNNTWSVNANGSISVIGGGGGAGTATAGASGGVTISNGLSVIGINHTGTSFRSLTPDKKSPIEFTIADWSAFLQANDSSFSWIIDNLLIMASFFELTRTLTGQENYVLAKLTRIEAKEELTEAIARLYIMDGARFGGGFFNAMAGIAMLRGIPEERLTKLSRQLDASKELTL